tara:strand:+ start:1936 stop:2406 length:471 start_codon:yes stop_codon:yes gene_type:complete
MVVMDSRKRRDGAAIEELGWYNPIDTVHSFDLKEGKILNWLQEGAQTTEAAHKLLRRAGIAHKWHLIKQGMEDTEIEKEMKKWELNREKVLNDRDQKLQKKVKNQEKEEVAKKEDKLDGGNEELPKTDVDTEDDGVKMAALENNEEQEKNNEMEEE